MFDKTANWHSQVCNRNLCKILNVKLGHLYIFLQAATQFFERRWHKLKKILSNTNFVGVRNDTFLKEDVTDGLIVHPWKLA